MSTSRCATPGRAAGTHPRHAVYTLRHDESARPRHRPDDRPVHRRRAWRHHRRPQQFRRGRDITSRCAVANQRGRCRSVKDQMFRVHPRMAMRRAGWLAWLAAASSEAAPPVRQVLLLQSFDRGNCSDHFTANFRVELDQRVGTCESRPGRRRAGRVCRRAGAGDRRLHPIHLRRSSQAGPHRGAGWPRGGLRAQVPTAALSGHAAPVRGRRSAISAQRAAGRERDRRRGRQRFSRLVDESCSCCPRPGRCSW